MSKILFITERNLAIDRLVESTLKAAKDRDFAIDIMVAGDADSQDLLQKNLPALTLLAPHKRYFLSDRASQNLPADANIVVVDSNICGKFDGEALLALIQKNLS